MRIDLVPRPREIVSGHGGYAVPAPEELTVSIARPEARPAAEILAARWGGRVVADPGGADPEAYGIRLRLVERAVLPDHLAPDLREDAHRLEVAPEGVELKALAPGGLLCGVATLLQMARREQGRLAVPCAAIRDWPAFRYRCAADWLVNVECNRWANDRGDGRAAFLARVRRKLDFCFAHKINLVWFDGFGWDTERFPGYAELMRECNRHARGLGIKLVFAGYGGGYGTAYQTGENYRCGYFGQVFRNRHAYPDGDDYPCRGWPESESRSYGTCLANAALRRLKLEEMKRFVTEVQPGFMYIHDIDAATWPDTERTWLERCPDCRRRWPSDALSSADGQAGACASWFAEVRRELSALPASGDYVPVHDLVTVFTSPLYTHLTEPGAPDNVWELEMQYYETLSREFGPAPGVEFGFREQFSDPAGHKKIGLLRRRLDQVGNGHGIHIIAFGGGDNFRSDDPLNISGALAHFYDGAESVCISNGGVHGEPVQMLNAEFLWSGSANGCREEPADQTEAKRLFEAICRGTHRPPELFATGGVFDRLCARLWGNEAGTLMGRALRARCDGRNPVSHVWWSITHAVMTLKTQGAGSLFVCHEREWERRTQATVAALECAREASSVTEDEDVHWFARCLEVGRRFAEAIRWLVVAEAGRDPAAAARFQTTIDALEEHIRARFRMERTDVLGGDPGCWQETIAELRNLAERFRRQWLEHGGIFGDFVDEWLVSRPMPPAGRLDELACPETKDAVGWPRRGWPGALCNLCGEFFDNEEADAIAFLTRQFECAEAMRLELQLGYHGPIRVWMDGCPVWHDPDRSGLTPQTRPVRHEAAVVPWDVKPGRHDVTIALAVSKDTPAGLFARFCRTDIATERLRTTANPGRTLPVGQWADSV